MKKLAATLGILLLVGVLAIPVFANRGDWSGWSRGPGSCWGETGAYGNMTENQNAELQKLQREFYNDTAKMRDEIWTKSEEFNSLLNEPDPDVKEAKTLQEEITDLKAKMDERRVDFQLEARKIAPNRGYARGYSRGYGRHHTMGNMMGPGVGYGHGPYWH